MEGLALQKVLRGNGEPFGVGEGQWQDPEYTRKALEAAGWGGGWRGARTQALVEAVGTMGGTRQSAFRLRRKETSR